MSRVSVRINKCTPRSDTHPLNSDTNKIHPVTSIFTFSKNVIPSKDLVIYVLRNKVKSIKFYF